MPFFFDYVPISNLLFLNNSPYNCLHTTDILIEDLGLLLVQKHE